MANDVGDILNRDAATKTLFPAPGLPGGGSWKPVRGADGDGAKLYIQKGSKMNDGHFDDEAPF